MKKTYIIIGIVALVVAALAAFTVFSRSWWVALIAKRWGYVKTVDGDREWLTSADGSDNISRDYYMKRPISALIQWYRTGKLE